MNTSEQLIDTTVAAEDLITDLERLISRAEAAIIRKPARELYTANPKLFEVNLALVRTSKAATTAKAGLLAAIGLPLTSTLALPMGTRR